jgi:hypothetical protein
MDLELKKWNARYAFTDTGIVIIRNGNNAQTIVKKDIVSYFYSISQQLKIRTANNKIIGTRLRIGRKRRLTVNNWLNGVVSKNYSTGCHLCGNKSGDMEVVRFFSSKRVKKVGLIFDKSPFLLNVCLSCINTAQKRFKKAMFILKITLCVAFAIILIAEFFLRTSSLLTIGLLAIGSLIALFIYFIAGSPEFNTIIMIEQFVINLKAGEGFTLAHTEKWKENYERRKISCGRGC